MKAIRLRGDRVVKLVLMKMGKRLGYSRDKRSDCVQVVVALVLTPEGFPVAYEVYPGNTRDTATLEGFLDRIEKQYGKFRRTWLMDRGIPTEKMLEEMRYRGIDYLVGTPKGHLTRIEKQLLEQPWIQARENVSVKILQQESEFYVYVESHGRVAKERSMRRRRLKRLWASLHELRNRKNITRDDLLMHTCPHENGDRGIKERIRARLWAGSSLHPKSSRIGE